MNASAKVWQGVLEEFNSETAYWAQYSLHPIGRAKHFAPWEGFAADGKFVASGALTEAQKHYPYVEGLEDSINEALRWMKRPPAQLREGLKRLSAGKQPDDLFAIFKLYGDFREHLAVLYARDPGHAGFPTQRGSSQAPQRKSGQAKRKNGDQKKSYKLKCFAASFMMAVIRTRGCTIKDGIIEARHWLEDFAANIVLGKKKAPKEFADYDFNVLLQKLPKKMGQSERASYQLHDKFCKELTAPHLDEWVDEVLVAKIQTLSLF